MTNRFSLTHWAEKKVESMANDIKSYIDMGLDQETAIDKVFDSSIVTMPYKMRALELCANYRHTHKFVLDQVTGRNWCATCQQFEQ